MRSIMLFTVLFSLLWLLASAGRHDRVKHMNEYDRHMIYNRVHAPQGWSRLHEAVGNELIEFTIVFKTKTDLSDLFWSVSTPSHDNYGNFLSYDEIVELVRLEDRDRAEVMQALSAHHINDAHIVNDYGDSIRIKAPARHLASFFNTRFYHFVHRATGHRTIKQLGEYSVPSSIAKHIRAIFGIHTFPTSEQRLNMKERYRLMDAVKKPQAVTPVYVPQSMTALYGMPALAPGANASISAGVIEFVEETFSPDHLTTFSKQTNIAFNAPTPDHMFGNNTEAPEGIEAALDIQWLSGVNPGLTSWFWLESDPNAWLYTFTQDFLTAKSVPQIISMSYGLPELDQCSYFNPSDCNGLSYTDYIHLVDQQFQKMGLMGVSVIVCSQDRGTYAADPAPFTPEYPGTSVYATSVGATETINSVYKLDNPPPACSAVSGWQCVSGGDEVAVSADVAGYLSGGGFSNANPMPDYQAQAVQNYFNSGVKLPASSLYNASGRGAPDVAAIGTNGYIYVGEDTLVGGTSMSTPIVAAITALLQADYISITGKPLGFLNPLIYEAAAKQPDVFNDITVGDNCSTAKCQGTQDGFFATKGWDPVTGVGSLNVPNLRQYVKDHANNVVARQAKNKA